MTCDASIEGAERASAGLATALAVYAWLEWE
jgi:hypothetical protein